MTDPFRFTHLALGQLEPFAPNLVLQFDAGVNVIYGRNGSGKTRLVNALKLQFLEYLQQGGSDTSETVLELVFPDLHDSPYPDEKWPRLIQWLAQYSDSQSAAQIVGEEATRIWQDLMGPFDPRSAAIAIQLTPEAIVHFIGVADREPIQGIYTGFADRIMLDLSLRIAFRKVKGLDAPMVLDDLGEFMSRVNTERIVQLLNAYVGQAIITANPLLDFGTPGHSYSLEQTSEGVVARFLVIPLKTTVVRSRIFSHTTQGSST